MNVSHGNISNLVNCSIIDCLDATNATDSDDESLIEAAVPVCIFMACLSLITIVGNLLVIAAFR